MIVTVETMREVDGTTKGYVAIGQTPGGRRINGLIFMQQAREADIPDIVEFSAAAIGFGRTAREAALAGKFDYNSSAGKQ